jgi:ribosomal protein L7/L12
MIRETKHIMLGIIRMAEENSKLLRDKAEEKDREASIAWQQLEKEREKHSNPLPYVYDLYEIRVATEICKANPKIQAIKLFRERFGSDLKRSKDLIDAIMNDNTGL